MTNRQVQTLCASLLAGALIGLAVQHFLLVRHHASIAVLAPGQVQLFRRSEDLLRSIDWVRRFAKANKLENTAAFKEVERQLARGETRPLGFDYSFWLARTETRGLPENADKDLFDLSQSGMSIRAITDEPSGAVRIAEFGALFGRDVLLRVSLTDQLDGWRRDALQHIAVARKTIIELRTSVDSLSRRIQDLDEVRSKYETNAVAGAGGGAAVQVQISGARYLSALQQIVALESERVDTEAQLRQAEQLLVRGEATARITAKWRGIFTAHDDTSTALKEIESDLDAERRQAESNNADNAVKSAIAELSLPVTSLRSRFVDASFSPPTPVVRREGPRAHIAILAGVALAFAGWVFAMRALRRSAQSLE